MSPRGSSLIDKWQFNYAETSPLVFLDQRSFSSQLKAPRRALMSGTCRLLRLVGNVPASARRQLFVDHVALVVMKENTLFLPPPNVAALIWVKLYVLKWVKLTCKTMEGLETEQAMIVIVAADQEISQTSNSLHQKYEFLSNSAEARANSDLKCL